MWHPSTLTWHSRCWGLSPGRTTETIVSINHLIKLSPVSLGTNASEFQTWEAELHPPALGHHGPFADTTCDRAQESGAFPGGESASGKE